MSPRSRAQDQQLTDYEPSGCPKMSHGALEKVKRVDGSVIYACKKSGCNYKENEKGEKI